MKMKTGLMELTMPITQTSHAAKPVFSRARTIRYVGPVTRIQTERTLKQIEKLLDASPEEEMVLFITSTGGPTGTAMSFYDTITSLLQPRLVTIGSGDVDSSGIILFLSGERRYISARTTLLLHPAGRRFDPQVRYTVREMEAMAAEDHLKDLQYATIVARASRGMLAVDRVLSMMEQHTILSPDALVEFGLADAVLE